MSQKGSSDTQNKPGRSAAAVALGYWREDPPDTFAPVTLRSEATHVLDYDPIYETYTMTPIDQAESPARMYVRAGSVVVTTP